MCIRHSFIHSFSMSTKKTAKTMNCNNSGRNTVSIIIFITQVHLIKMLPDICLDWPWPIFFKVIGPWSWSVCHCGHHSKLWNIVIRDTKLAVNIQSRVGFIWIEIGSPWPFLRVNHISISKWRKHEFLQLANSWHFSDWISSSGHVYIAKFKICIIRSCWPTF